LKSGLALAWMSSSLHPPMLAWFWTAAFVFSLASLSLLLPPRVGALTCWTLRRESLYADALDQTASGSTSDAMYVMLNALHPPSGGPFCFLFPTIATRALPRVLAEKSYSTLHVMTYDGAFWNTRVMAEHSVSKTRLHLNFLNSLTRRFGSPTRCFMGTEFSNSRAESVHPWPGRAAFGPM
jgi:hypothetical protein